MDLETENRIAAILMKEAAELRRQAEKEGVHAYLRKPDVRFRPNSRFLTATVLGLQQANRAVEVSEMWRVRQKELELDDRLKGRLKSRSSNGMSHGHTGESSAGADGGPGAGKKSASGLCSSSKNVTEDCCSMQDGGLRDQEVEEFLNSRVKRGRGAVGSRMDETGPYLPPCPGSKGNLLANPEPWVREEWERRPVLGSEKSSPLKSFDSPEEQSSEEESHEHRHKKSKRGSSGSSNKHHSRRHRSEEKSRGKKKKKKEKKRKHRN
ncbi:uncharacterized protein LOC131164047 isoform X3 [Malania oleifera]|uniref:uncharacterized protein LOC131164047 isoform X3 n=1 Tax=Malania oleifera TaxID=397392 RepID=UPI0025ADD81C|nr:uncharacterized protein LOC131164047 isoform X3 [Malania oleifera]